MITFLVPPGIGDFSAMYSKLCGLDREIAIQPTGDGPRRLIPFLEILPKVKHEDYGNFPTNLSLIYTVPPGTDIMKLPDGEHFLSVNEWLESGHSIQDWIPGPTDYHYRIDVTREQGDAVQELMSELPVDAGVLIGVYCSAYGNSRHWGFWGPDKWFVFLKEIRERIPEGMNPIFIFIGAEYDLGIAEAVVRMMLDYNYDIGRTFFKQIYTLGRFHIGSTIELIKKLNYFFVFPSGLGFLADVVDTPHMMWFPPNLDRMRYTFSDPANNYGKTLHIQFGEPEDMAKLFEENGLQKMKESYDTIRVR